MARVTGVGGVFVRARDPDALRDWYHEALGIDFDLGTAVRFGVADASDVVVFALFDQASTYIGDPERQGAMVNFVVDDLDGALRRLEDMGAPIEEVQDEGYGRFSWSSDPEGNRIELWQPPTGSKGAG